MAYRFQASLEHPNVVPVHDLGIDPENQVFFVMKRIAGQTLEERSELIRSGESAWPLRRRLEVLLRVGDALAFAHRRGVVHRDLKPANVMVGSFGEVLLLDWGLTRLSESFQSEAHDEPEEQQALQDLRLTLAGEVLGTPSYLAPEQARADLLHEHFGVDVFGLGGLLFFLLTGKALYEGSSTTEVREAARCGVWRADLLRARAIPPELRSICTRALAHDPGDRYASVDDLIRDVRAYLENRPGEAWRDDPVRRLNKFTRRHPVIVTSLLGAALAVALGQALFTQRNARALAREELTSAQHEAADLEFHARILSAQGNTSSRLGVGTPSSYHAPLLSPSSHLVDAFALSGYDLREDSERLSAALSDLATRNPQVHELALGSLSYVVLGMLEGRIAAASWTLDETSGLSDGERDRIRDARASFPDLIELWPRLEAHVDRLFDGRRRDFYDAASFAAKGDGRALQALCDSPPPALSADELELLGLAARLCNRSTRAPALFQAAMELDEGRYWSNLYLGISRFRAEDYLGALLSWSKARMSNPKAPALLANMAQALHLLDRHEEAIFTADQALACDPNNVFAHTARGRALDKLGREDDALESFGRAISIEPDFFDANISFAHILTRRGEWSAAEEIARRMVELYPLKSNGTIVLAEVLRNTDRGDEGALRCKELQDSIGEKDYLCTLSAACLLDAGLLARSLFEWEQLQEHRTEAIDQNWGVPGLLRDIPQWILAMHGRLESPTSRDLFGAARAASARRFHWLAYELYREAMDVVERPGIPFLSDSERQALRENSWLAIRSTFAALESEGFEFEPGVLFLESGESIPEALEREGKGSWKLDDGAPSSLTLALEEEEELVAAALDYARLWAELVLSAETPDAPSNSWSRAPLVRLIEFALEAELPELDDELLDSLRAAMKTLDPTPVHVP